MGISYPKTKYHRNTCILRVSYILKFKEILPIPFGHPQGATGEPMNARFSML